MQFDGVILYGPPASGKDTVTAELCKLNDAYAYFEKLKAGPGRKKGYRVVSEEQLADLRERGLIVHEVARYGATYAVDSSALDDLHEGGRIPIVHMGQVAGVVALQRYRPRWLDVLLWCSKDATNGRLRNRGSVDIDDRLSVWNATLTVIKALSGPRFTLSIRTDAVMPSVTAAVIHSALNASE